MAQAWAATAAAHHSVSDVPTFSGGTEATAFNPRAVDALRRAGFQIDQPSGDNPRHHVSFSDERAPHTYFSKKYDDGANPTERFAAVMTCSAADAACPFVPGATFRIALPYDDPKSADDTPDETARYDQRSRQIAAEMFYVFERVADAS